MNTTIKTALVAILFLAVSCKKENNTIQSTSTGNSSSSAFITDSHEPGRYVWVKIGTQKWMSTNLAVSRYRNGDRIPQVKDPTKWAALTTGAWCWYNNDSANGAVYGKLYNWYAVNDPRGLAPKGWYVPSDTEWNTLKTYLGDNAGGKLKATGTIESGKGLWYKPNKGATNETGFTGLPGGYRGYNGNFSSVGYNGNWWSSTEFNAIRSWRRYLNYRTDGIGRNSYYKNYGLSVRCLKD